MKRISVTVLALVVFLLLNGCAVGNKHAYHDSTIDLKCKGSAKIGVATHDQRPYIVDGKKRPDFVGLQRGGYGNPFNVSTASGNPLATDITDTLTRSLKSKGFEAIPLTITKNDNADTIKTNIKSKNFSRTIITTLYEWKSDTMTNTGLSYDVEMQVLDTDGNKIAQRKISGGDNLGGSMMNPPAHAKRAIPVAFKEKFELLLNDEQIAKALLDSEEQ